jgi:hypothetical protein
VTLVGEMFLSEADISPTPLAPPPTEHIRTICIGSLMRPHQKIVEPPRA